MKPHSILFANEAFAHTKRIYRFMHTLTYTVCACWLCYIFAHTHQWPFETLTEIIRKSATNNIQNSIFRTLYIIIRTMNEVFVN